MSGGPSSIRANAVGTVAVGDGIVTISGQRKHWKDEPAASLSAMIGQPQF
jgi:hypothetical protein